MARRRRRRVHMTTRKHRKGNRYKIKRIGYRTSKKRKAKRRKRPTRKSFSPPVNKLLLSLKTISPNPSILTCKSKTKINIAPRGRTQCVSWRSAKARKAMLRNVQSKKPINCRDVVAPKQLLSNCWFNAFFMVFFISDKGRKFHRFLRETMITSRLPSGQMISPRLQWPFFLLNKYIEASLRGRRDTSHFAELMDTNRIIRSIYKKISHKKGIAKTREAANPLTYYIAIMNYLGHGDPQFALTWANIRHKEPKDVKRALVDTVEDSGHVPNMLFIEYEENVHGTKQPTIQFKYDDHHYKYKLDAIVLRDVEGSHFSAYITCRGRDFGFDGDSFSRLIPFPWKNRLNKDSQWNFAGDDSSTFSFDRGYRVLLYYRV